MYKSMNATYIQFKNKEIGLIQKIYVRKKICRRYKPENKIIRKKYKMYEKNLGPKRFMQTLKWLSTTTL